MNDAPEILFLITARGGSKGLPGKNLKRIEDVSLLGFKARSAQKCRYCTRLILSTDSEEVQEEGRTLGVEVPFTRPASLATDEATSESVVAHAIEWIEQTEGRQYDAIMLLEPSSPFATAAHYTKAVNLYLRRSADLIVGLRELDTYPVFTGDVRGDGSIAHIVKAINGTSFTRRQDQPTQVTMNGALYLIRWETFKTTGKIYSNPENCFGVVMDQWHSIEIETPEDLALAKWAVEKRCLDIAHWHP